MLEITRFVFNNFEENTYLAVDSATRKAAIIDPGMLSERECLALEDYISEKEIILTQIILTHAHLDHCFGADFVKNKYNVPLKVHSDDKPLAEKVHLQAKRFGMFQVFNSPLTIDVELSEGDIIEIGKSSLEVIHVPGHSPGGMVLYDKADGVAFVGDSIFQNSIGRTDLEGGDFETLIHSLISKVLILPDKTVLLSGHGEPTTVESEKKHNPFLRR